MYVQLAGSGDLVRSAWGGSRVCWGAQLVLRAVGVEGGCWGLTRATGPFFGHAGDNLLDRPSSYHLRRSRVS